MWKVLARARESFARDQRGNVAVIFAFTAVPMIGLLGGAVDVSREHRYKVELSNALDAAAIALVRHGAKNDADADAFVNSYMATMTPGGGRDPMLHMARYDATAIASGYRVTGSGYMDTAFLPVVGIRKMVLDLSTEVMTSGGKYEIALALDNTGSMRNYGRIEALRDASSELVDDLYSKDGAKNRVKMALVPFVTAVNVGNSPDFDSSFIDPTGDSTIFGKNFSQPVDRLDLFRKMHVQWGGCVEARAEGDLDDTAPTSAATRWVPYLWPDEPDRGYDNSYLRDSVSGSDSARLRDVAKYNVGAGVTVPDSSDEGPNAACPSPVVPLTNDADMMKREIGKMRPHNEAGGNNSGTNIAQGLVWGWRVLSPGKPFEEGAPYTDTTTQKVLVLLSDGRNQVVPNTEITRSDYTPYGYLADGRMGTTSNYLVAEQNVDANVKSVCDKVKAQGIRVYTILFQVDYAKSQDLFRNCASKNDKGEPLYYYVPEASALQQAFNDIGQDLTTLHISR